MQECSTPTYNTVLIAPPCNTGISSALAMETRQHSFAWKLYHYSVKSGDTAILHETIDLIRHQRIIYVVVKKSVSTSFTRTTDVFPQNIAQKKTGLYI